MRPDVPPVPIVRHARPELLPCPFCGGPAEYSATDGTDHMVGCGAANACPAYAVAGPYDTAAEAAAAWNKRA